MAIGLSYDMFYNEIYCCERYPFCFLLESVVGYLCSTVALQYN